jgi:hypothetical protein
VVLNLNLEAVQAALDGRRAVNACRKAGGSVFTCGTAVVLFAFNPVPDAGLVEELRLR